MAHDPNESRTRDDVTPLVALTRVLEDVQQSLGLPRMQVETHCSACGREMFVVRRIRKFRTEPDTEPLCAPCVTEMLDEMGRDEQELPGSTCTGACGWCGRCS